MTQGRSLASEVGLSPSGLRTSVHTGPWSSEQGVGVAAANAMALLLAFVAWWQTGGIATARSQLGWFDLSLVGVVVAIASNAWFLAKVRRMVRLGREVALAGIQVPSAVTDGSRPDGDPTRPRKRSNLVVPAGKFVAGQRMSRYHSAGCLLVADKEVTAGSRTVHERSGRRPCEVCAP